MGRQMDVQADCSKKKLDLRSGSHAIDISKSSLTCPYQHRPGPFYGYSVKPPYISRLLGRAKRYGLRGRGHLNPPPPRVPTGQSNGCIEIVLILANMAAVYMTTCQL